MTYSEDLDMIALIVGCINLSVFCFILADFCITHMKHVEIIWNSNSMTWNPNTFAP